MAKLTLFNGLGGPWALSVLAPTFSALQTPLAAARRARSFPVAHEDATAGSPGRVKGGAAGDANP
jgi:hypothetical protein